MLRKPNVRRGCTDCNPITWPSTKKSEGSKKFATTGSVDCCSILQENQFVMIHLRVDITWVLSVAGSLPMRGQSLTSNRL